MIIAGLIYIGKLYSLYQNKIKLSIPVALLCIVGLCIATVYKYNINVGGMTFGNPILFILISFASCYMVLTFAGYINKKSGYLACFFDYIGNSTLTIMALHYFSFKLVTFIQVVVYDYPINYLAYYPVIPYKISNWWIIYTIVGLFVPLLCSFLFDTVKVTVRKRNDYK
jgi:fucose 4-O-acetylase-like acetyltransferase